MLLAAVLVYRSFIYRLASALRKVRTRVEASDAFLEAACHASRRPGWPSWHAAGKN